MSRNKEFVTDDGGPDHAVRADESIPEAVVATEEQLAAAFTEWDRQWREDPTAFMSDQEHLATGITTYGQLCARTLVKMLKATEDC